MATLYRLLTGDDSSEFCHKVTAALEKGWELHGSQAGTKEIPGDYDPDKKLGEQ